jgi:hypothetical protein
MIRSETLSYEVVDELISAFAARHDTSGPVPAEWSWMLPQR